MAGDRGYTAAELGVLSFIHYAYATRWQRRYRTVTAVLDDVSIAHST
jgi:hypothetical protein